MLTRVLAFSVLATLSLNACSTDVTSSSNQPARRFEFMNGPGQLPQVLRFEGRTIAGWVDLQRNTGIIIGAPLQPELSRLCGGTVRNQLMPIQFVGDLDDVVKQLLLEQDANVLVYNSVAPSLLDALCGSEPWGTGQGFYLRSDNDFFGTGFNRTNAFGDHVEARVTLTTGVSAAVAAGIRGIGRDGQLVFRESWVIVAPAGGGN